MSGVMDRIREAAARAASGPLADARERPAFPRVAAQSPFPPEAGPEQFVARFRSELEALTGKVYGPLDAEGVARQVVELVRAAVGDGETGGRGDGETGRRGDAGTRRRGEGDGGIPSPSGRGATLRSLALRGEGSSTQHPALSTQDSESSTQNPEPFPRLRLLSWDETELGCPGLGEALRHAGIEMVPGDVPNDASHQRVLEGLAALGVGLSGALAGLADTGSIVVASGPGRSRVASLLPPIHIAVLPVGRLYPTMQDWLADGGTRLVRERANVVVITGSSRTSDIELQLTLGMHGPKELHVVLYEPSASGCQPSAAGK